MTFDLHLLGAATFARLNTVVIFGAIVSGLALCAIGAIVYDVGRFISVW
jgi:hypothetical protein